MIKKIKISQELLDEMRTHITRVSPLEACGLIIGKVVDDIAYGEIIVKIKNIQKSTVEFLMDPTELYNAYMLAEKMKKEVIAVYHSHPSGTYPSPHDLRNMELNPYVWIIFDMNDLSFRAFFLEDKEKKQLYEVEVIVI
ncbi:MAG: M67 family metallopeptidase [Candidatus Asgardarchaeia archaeon]